MCFLFYFHFSDIVYITWSISTLNHNKYNINFYFLNAFFFSFSFFDQKKNQNGLYPQLHSYRQICLRI